MEFSIVVVLIIIVTCSFAKDRPTCAKLDTCSCYLTGVENPGIINLYSLVNGKHEPAFIVEGKSNHTNLYYNFSYNPCFNFSDFGCPETGVCQTGDGVQSYDLGNLGNVEFFYMDDVAKYIRVVYKSKYKDKFGQSRVSSVDLICDEYEEKGRFEYSREPVVGCYQFKLYTQCACPGRCAPPETVCKAKDSCSCEMSDGSGIIYLHSLDNPSRPLKDQLSPSNTFLYNPCSPMTDPQCYDSSLCEKQGDSLLPLGNASSANFVFNNNQLGIQYFGVNNTLSTVNLHCDPNQRDEPFFRSVGDGHTFSLYSACACPNGCGPPPSNGSCDQTDSCTCKSSNGTVINLHDLDHPYAPLIAKDSEGYTYYYNPCSGIKLQNPVGKCNGVAACQEDPLHNTWYNIGNNGPDIYYSTALNLFLFLYTGGEGGRTFSVRMVCDHNSTAPVLATDSYIPKGAIHYPLKLITKYACY